MTKSIYLAGPMTGFKWELVKKCFDTAQQLFERDGFVVYNPAVIGYQTGWRYTDYIEVSQAIQKLARSIFMLPGWEESKGARFEKHVAEVMGQEIIEAPKVQEAVWPIYQAALMLKTGICPRCGSKDVHYDVNEHVTCDGCGTFF